MGGQGLGNHCESKGDQGQQPDLNSPHLPQPRDPQRDTGVDGHGNRLGHMDTKGQTVDIWDHRERLGTPRLMGTDWDRQTRGGRLETSGPRAQRDAQGGTSRCGDTWAHGDTWGYTGVTWIHWGRRRWTGLGGHMDPQ